MPAVMGGGGHGLQLQDKFYRQTIHSHSYLRFIQGQPLNNSYMFLDGVGGVTFDLFPDQLNYFTNINKIQS